MFAVLWERSYRDGRDMRHLIAVEPLPQKIMQNATRISRVYAGATLVATRGASLLSIKQDQHEEHPDEQ